VLLVGTAGLCVLSWVLIVTVDVKTVLFSGPPIFILGAALVAAGVKGGYYRAAALGMAHCGVCLLCLGLVNLFRWSPQRAALPFSLMGCFYLLLETPVALLVWRRAPRNYPFDRRHCCWHQKQAIQTHWRRECPRPRTSAATWSIGLRQMA